MLDFWLALLAAVKTWVSPCMEELEPPQQPVLQDPAAPAIIVVTVGCWFDDPVLKSKLIERACYRELFDVITNLWQLAQPRPDSTR